jgi:salicylate hydroxylase
VSLQVILVGGGIGGLAAAAALAPTAKVILIEQAPELLEIGAGLQVSPNASRVLQRLGLGDALQAIGYEPAAFEIRDALSGALMLRQPLRAAARTRWGAPHYNVHRGDLHRMLAGRAVPASTVLLGARVESIEQAAGRARVRLTDGRTVEGDVVVGCDGVRSVVRSALWGTQKPRFTGLAAWRGSVPAERLPAGLVPPTTSVWTGQGRHFVHYFVRGGALVNFVGLVESPDWTSESWTERGDKADLARDFAGWPDPVGPLIAAAPEAWRWAVFDRPPLPRWSKGRATLLGDAAHPMLPSFAQGASQAIEDAEALARLLGLGGDPVAALAAYESERRGRTARVQALSTRNLRLFHSGPLARPAFAAERALSRLGLTKGEARLDWLYGYDASVRN